jgi:hypothetical protein
VIIKQTYDIDLIKRIFCEPEIYERIRDDGSPEAKDFNPVDPSNYVYYLTDDSESCLLYLSWKNCVTLDGHIQILKNHRNNAMEFGKLAKQWIWDNTKARKIEVTIPDIYPDVLQFIQKQGFIVEGLSTNSYLKNGKLHNQVNLGLEK